MMNFSSRFFSGAPSAKHHKVEWRSRNLRAQSPDDFSARSPPGVAPGGNDFWERGGGGLEARAARWCLISDHSASGAIILHLHALG
jgi:hypothetical protein